MMWQKLNKQWVLTHPQFKKVYRIRANPQSFYLKGLFRRDWNFHSLLNFESWPPSRRSGRSSALPYPPLGPLLSYSFISCSYTGIIIVAYFEK